MRTFTYAGPDGVEVAGHWAAEWMVLEGDGEPVVTPPDVAREAGPLLRVELRPDGGDPWWLGVPLGDRELATVAHGLFPLPGTERVLVAFGLRAWVVKPCVRGSVEPVDERVAGAVTSVVADEEVVAVASSTALAGYRVDASWWAEPDNIGQIALVGVVGGVLHAIAVLGGDQVVGLAVDAWDGDLLEEPEVLARGSAIRRVSERRFQVSGPGGRRRGEARFDLHRGRWRVPSVYGV